VPSGLHALLPQVGPRGEGDACSRFRQEAGEPAGVTGVRGHVGQEVLGGDAQAGAIRQVPQEAGGDIDASARGVSL
jgi:hypothetical protein